MDDRTRNRLQDMGDFAQKAIGFLGNMSWEEFELDGRTNLAITRCIEIIGEAASHLSKETKADMPEIEWKQIIGIRVVLAHAYMRITLRTLYDIVKNDLPKLINQLDEILENDYDHDT